MTYTIQNLVNSIAAQIAGAVPGYPIYDNPNQQGTEFPCFFVFLMPSDTADEIGMEKRNIWFDVVFVQERNIPGANEQINQIADTLDYLFDSINYTDGIDTVPLHTHERSYSIEDQELHYKFRISQRVSYPTEHNPMQEEETNVETKEP